MRNYRKLPHKIPTGNSRSEKSLGKIVLSFGAFSVSHHAPSANKFIDALNNFQESLTDAFPCGIYSIIFI